MLTTYLLTLKMQHSCHIVPYLGECQERNRDFRSPVHQDKQNKIFWGMNRNIVVGTNLTSQRLQIFFNSIFCPRCRQGSLQERRIVASFPMSMYRIQHRCQQKERLYSGSVQRSKSQKVYTYRSLYLSFLKNVFMPNCQAHQVDQTRISTPEEG